MTSAASEREAGRVALGGGGASGLRSAPVRLFVVEPPRLVGWKTFAGSPRRPKEACSVMVRPCDW